MGLTMAARCECLPPLTAFVTLAADHRLATEAFIRSAFDQLGLEYVETAGVYRVPLPEAQRAWFDELDELQFTCDPALAEQHAALGVELVTLDHTLIDQLAEALRSQGEAIHWRPAACPQSVHPISRRLFSAYKIDGGNVHLAGCQLEDRPFVRLTYRQANAAGPEPLFHWLFDPRGEPVSKTMQQTLGLEELIPYAPRPPRLVAGALEAMLASGEAAAHARLLSTAEEPLPELLVRALVWCKYVQGKLRFSIGEASEEVSFAGWASQLEAPAFVCPQTGTATFHLAATDDGVICAAEEIDLCSESGRRVLRRDLIECSETGRRVLQEFAANCPVTHQFVLRTLLETCPSCRQQVSPAAMTKTVCQACCNLQPVEKADPRMARLLGEHPGLDRWRKWKLAETETVYIAQAASLLRRLLVVVDKQTLAPLHLATRHRLFAHWNELSAALRDEMLR